MTSAQLDRIRRLLCALQDHVRETLIAARDRHQSGSLARIAAVTAADTIYEIDRISEDAIVAWFEQHWPRAWPVELVMEGIEEGDEVTVPRGTPRRQTIFKCIVDPIDGTRGLMYDKRSAWMLAGVAPQRGARTHLGDIIVAAMTELPVSKQWRADQFSAVRGSGLKATAVNVLTGHRARLRARPSTATDFKHAFASFARFFPAGRVLTSQLEEALWSALHGPPTGGSPLVFDDQYISTGGQLAELLVGHDRMIGDVRPLVFARLGLPAELVCHPYDICTALLLQEAGGVVESPIGRPLRAPLDTVSPVAWMGYANPALAQLVRPVLRRLIEEML